MARGSGAGPAGRHGAELHDVQRLDFDKSCGVSLMMNSKEILGRACKWRPSSVYRYDTHSPTKEVKWPAVRARAVNVGRNAGRSVGKRARSGGRKKPTISQSAGGCWGVAAGPKCASGTEKAQHDVPRITQGSRTLCAAEGSVAVSSLCLERGLAAVCGAPRAPAASAAAHSFARPAIP